MSALVRSYSAGNSSSSKESAPDESFLQRVVNPQQKLGICLHLFQPQTAVELFYGAAPGNPLSIVCDVELVLICRGAHQTMRSLSPPTMKCCWLQPIERIQSPGNPDRWRANRQGQHASRNHTLSKNEQTLKSFKEADKRKDAGEVPNLCLLFVKEPCTIGNNQKRACLS